MQNEEKSSPKRAMPVSQDEKQSVSKTSRVGGEYTEAQKKKDRSPSGNNIDNPADEIPGKD
jgi:hypothetical protein